ncbi:MAG: thioredoxin domain-containing protein [Myxococcales bacterium]|nr:thioredoxin domain-containing protein [Myxococcota bacterium]MDW8282366.1 thioredoxin domain-containing protein [Myxococcales bacterium]
MDRLILTLVGLLLGPVALAAAPDLAPANPSIPGVDTSQMTPSEKATLVRLAEKFPSGCGKPHSLLVSLRTDPGCRRSQMAIQTLRKWLLDGFLPSEVEERYEARYLSKPYDIDITGAPVRGDPKAPVALVEFSDFECPHCKMAGPHLKRLLAEQPKVKLVFFNFPLGAHPNAALAAAAAIAAGKQGKFWAYHDKLFENQGRLSPAEFTRIAQELKLDIPRFLADMEGAKVRVARERALGDKLEISGTPAFFINGRRYTDRVDYETLRAWVEEELAR